MSFEAFNIYLTPIEQSLRQLANVEEIAEEIPARFPALRPDTEEASEGNTRWFVSETECGLFQVGVYENGANSVRFVMQYALSNPRSVYAPFCACASELMQTYGLSLHVGADAPPNQNLPDEITDTEDLCSLLLPAMDYNRFLWQSDMQTTEEIALRPGNAVARFLPDVLIH